VISSTEVKTPIPTLDPNVPDVFHKPIAKKLLFSNDEDCVLPCWFGLEVGISKSDEIAPAFRRALGLSDGYEFKENFAVSVGDDSRIEDDWVLLNDSANGNPPRLTIVASYYPQSGLLNRLYFSWINFDDYPTTPRQVMKELGVPDQFFFSYFPQLADGIVDFRVQFFYLNKGLVIEMDSRLGIQQTEQGNNFAEWCLDGNKSYKEYAMTTTILPMDRVREWAELQQTVWDPFEDVFKTDAEILDRSVEELDENTCFKLDL
jgi:hypothetical protein